MDTDRKRRKGFYEATNARFRIGVLGAGTGLAFVLALSIGFGEFDPGVAASLVIVATFIVVLLAILRYWATPKIHRLVQRMSVANSTGTQTSKYGTYQSETLDVARDRGVQNVRRAWYMRCAVPHDRTSHHVDCDWWRRRNASG